MNIFVAKLSPNTDETSLKTLFTQYGEVSSTKVIMDRDTGRSKCFGFVEMGDTEGLEAIDKLNETEYEGSTIVVKKAQPREDSGGYRGGGNRYGNDRGGNDRGGYQNRDRGGDNRGGDRGNSSRRNEGFDTSKW